MPAAPEAEAEPLRGRAGPPNGQCGARGAGGPARHPGEGRGAVPGPGGRAGAEEGGGAHNWRREPPPPRGARGCRVGEGPTRAARARGRGGASGGSAHFPSGRRSSSLSFAFPASLLPSLLSFLAFFLPFLSSPAPFPARAGVRPLCDTYGPCCPSCPYGHLMRPVSLGVCSLRNRPCGVRCSSVWALGWLFARSFLVGFFFFLWGGRGQGFIFLYLHLEV